MLRIGEFSKIAQVSIKTLRYYDQLGLLKPAHIDRYSGYRYYNLSQLFTLNRILALKDLDFSLDQIQHLLVADVSSETLEKMLRQKARALKQRITDDQSRLERVVNRLNLLNDTGEPKLSPMVLKSAPDQLVATIREVLPSSNLLKDWQIACREKIHYNLQQFRQTQTGPDILIFHQDEFRDVDLDVEVGTIIHHADKNNKTMTNDYPFRIYTLQGSPLMATILLNPSTTMPSEIYANLASWTQVNGFRPIGPWRELILETNGADPTQIIEVQRPVMRAKEYYQELEDFTMTPKIKTHPSFTIVGLPYFGKNENQEISQLWTSFNQRIKELGGLKHETGQAAIGLCLSPEDEPIDGAFEYVAGFPVSKVEEVPDGFVVRRVPEHTYAVFTHKGNLKGLSKTYEYIYETWLPQSGYQLADRLDFEYYNEDFKNFTPDSIFYIYIPIKKA